ncbi:MAG: hypothetical protein PHQ75_07575 [Thermoguttaceae bacterium]|nr:hypothetical protein [Thermoguttaceae bacterium]
MELLETLSEQNKAKEPVFEQLVRRAGQLSEHRRLLLSRAVCRRVYEQFRERDIVRDMLCAGRDFFWTEPNL